jgi:hypothetical protein
MVFYKIYYLLQQIETGLNSSTPNN